MRRLIERTLHALTRTPWASVLVAAALLAASLALGVASDNARRAEAAQQARVQAQILGASLAAPLAFGDAPEVRDYIFALRNNPDIEAAAVYDLDGRLTAGFDRAGSPPATAPPSRTGPPGAFTIAAPVTQGTTRLGSVFLRFSAESATRRLMRYLGIGLIVLMASLLVAGLGASQASLREANLRLRREAVERQKAEQALRQAQRMEVMGQITGGVAHDFNNLLMVASSGLELMRRTSDRVRRARLESSVRDAIDRGATLTRKLLAFSLRAPLRPEAVDLGRRLLGMKEMLQASLGESIGLRIEAARNLWPVKADAAELELAILNVALNARDAMPSGGMFEVALANQSEEGAERVRITLSDTGVGMAPELAPRVFEPFFTTKAVGKGTGLGLSQVYGFATASGGEARFESSPGAGSIVTLFLPRSSERPTERDRAPGPTNARAALKGRVLVVEDDDRVAELVCEMLGELGYTVTRSASAAAALKALERADGIDVVFSDMIMPGEISGLDLARRVLASHPGLPVVLTTGFSVSAAEAAAEGLRVLQKPYRIESLDEALASALATVH